MGSGWFCSTRKEPQHPGENAAPRLTLIVNAVCCPQIWAVPSAGGSSRSRTYRMRIKNPLPCRSAILPFGAYFLRLTKSCCGMPAPRLTHPGMRRGCSVVSRLYRCPHAPDFHGRMRGPVGIRQPASFQRLALRGCSPTEPPIFSRFLATFRIGGRGGTRTRVVRLMMPGWNLLQLPCHVCPAWRGAR